MSNTCSEFLLLVHKFLVYCNQEFHYHESYTTFCTEPHKTNTHLHVIFICTDLTSRPMSRSSTQISGYIWNHLCIILITSILRHSVTSKSQRGIKKALFISTNNGAVHHVIFSALPLLTFPWDSPALFPFPDLPCGCEEPSLAPGQNEGILQNFKLQYFQLIQGWRRRNILN
jgi:hypothetical protein